MAAGGAEDAEEKEEANGGPQKEKVDGGSSGQGEGKDEKKNGAEEKIAVGQKKEAEAADGGEIKTSEAKADSQAALEPQQAEEHGEQKPADADGTGTTQQNSKAKKRKNKKKKKKGAQDEAGGDESFVGNSPDKNNNISKQ